MSVDIFMEIVFCAPAFGQVPKIEPVVPNLMSLSNGSRPLAFAGEAAARAAVETMKWRRLSMAVPLFLLGRCLKSNRNGLALLLRRLRQKPRNPAGRGCVERAIPTQRHAFARLVVGHEIVELSGSGAADIDAFLAVAVVIARIERVVGADEQPAWMVEATEFSQPIAILVEDLDTAIDAIGDEKPALGVECQRVRIA